MPHPYSLVAFKALIKQWLLQIFFSAVPRHIFALKQNPMGLNLIGYFQGDLGLGQALRYIAKAVEAAAIPFLVRRFKAPLQSSQSNHSLDPFLAAYCQYPVNLITVNPDLLYRLPTWVSYSEWAKRYNIGYWFWELEKFPDRWRYALHLIDEIWVNTEFVANWRVHTAISTKEPPSWHIVCRGGRAMSVQGLTRCDGRGWRAQRGVPLR